METACERAVCGCRASFDGRYTMRLVRGSAIRCTTSKCALPMVSLGYLDRDWCEAPSLPSSELAGAPPCACHFEVPVAGAYIA